jgi:glycosyltransferase involved in cell wall biosynthesis
VVEHVPAGPARSVGKDDLLPYMPTFARFLSARLIAEPADVVHAHFWMSGLAASAATRDLPIPFVQTFHALGTVKRRYQGDADTSPPDRQRIEAELARRAARIVATCSDEARELTALGADPARIDVVPCGVDLELFTPGPPASESRRIVVAGRLVPRKGVDDVIRASTRLPGAELVIAGGPPGPAFNDDPEVRRLRTLAGSLGVADRVRLIGPVPRDRMPELLRSARVVVAVPWYEPFGIVPVEAMACGRPVVAAATGGMLDTVADGQTGVLVPPRDPGALAAALQELFADPQRCRRLCAMAARRARRYGWSRVATDTERAYESVLPAEARR